MRSAKALSLLTEVLYLFFFFSLACSFRIISSMSLALILVTGFINNWRLTGTLFNKNINNLFFYGCLLLSRSPYCTDLLRQWEEGWQNIQVKSGLMFTPLAICCTNFINDKTRKKAVPLSRHYNYRYFIILFGCCVIKLFSVRRSPGLLLP